MNFFLFAGVICLMFASFCAGAFIGSTEEKATRAEKAVKKRGSTSHRIAYCIIGVDGVATLWVLALCTLAILRGFTGSLPYLTTLIGALQAATAYVLGHYFKKSSVENKRGGIVYEAAMKNPTPDC